MLRFRTNIYARPASLVLGETITLRDVKLSTLCGEGMQTIFDAFLPVAFEDALLGMQQLPRMDAEPDGYFVLTGQSQGQRWQIDGHLFDFGERLHRVEMSGQCPAETFGQLLATFAPKPTELAFELVREGIILDPQNFLRWATAD